MGCFSGKSIKVTIISAKKLKDTDGPFNKSDPYVYLQLGDCKPKRTSTVKGDLNPAWNETVNFSVDSPATKTLKLGIFDQDFFFDDRLGSCEVDLGKLKQTTDPQEFEEVVAPGLFWNSKLKFTIETDGTWGNPPDPVDIMVNVQSSTGLKNGDFIGMGTSDPYVYIELEGCQAQQTTVKKDTVNPVWDEVLTFTGVTQPLTKTLKIGIWDKDRLTPDDRIGYCEVDLAELKYCQEETQFEKLVDWKLFGLLRKSYLKLSVRKLGEWGNA